VRGHLPAEVSSALDRRTGSVLVDAEQLAAARNRFDDAQAESLARYLGSSQSANTVRAYRADWHGWLAWCAAQGRTALPADPLDVAVYLAAAADTRRPESAGWAFAPATLERKAAAIAAVHASAGLPSPTRADVVRLTLRGIRRARNARPNRKRPVLLHTLADMLDQRPAEGWPGSLVRRRDAVLLLIGFAGALRRTELAGLRVEDAGVQAEARTGEPVLVVELAATKTDPTGMTGQRVALPRGQRRDTCPICAFADWTDVLSAHRELGATPELKTWLAGRKPASTHRCHDFTGTALTGPLFPGISRHGHLSAAPISGRAVGDLVKRYAERAGLDPAAFAGHSLRAGFATQAALGGASDREIMRQGRWSNAATVHRYIRTANPLEDNAVTKLGL
jgi:integrase